MRSIKAPVPPVEAPIAMTLRDLLFCKMTPSVEEVVPGGSWEGAGRGRKFLLPLPEAALTMATRVGHMEAML